MRLLITSVGLAIAVAGCGDVETSTEQPAPTEQTKDDAPKAELKLDLAPGKTQKRRVAISGIATPGLRISAENERVFSKENGRFRLDVPLKIGRNRITVYAQGAEVQGSREDVVVRRTKPPAPPREPAPAPEAPAPPPAGPDACPSGRSGVPPNCEEIPLAPEPRSDRCGPGGCLPPSSEGQCPPGEVVNGADGYCIPNDV